VSRRPPRLLIFAITVTGMLNNTLLGLLLLAAQVLGPIGRSPVPSPARR
jgi:hypothetical protein